MAAGWSKAITYGEDWIGEAAKTNEESMTSRGIFEKQLALTSIMCPRCGEGQDPKGMRLITSAGLLNVRCSRCKGTSPSSIWKCRCRIHWIKCPRHEHVPNQTPARQTDRIHRSRTGKSFDIRGRDVPDQFNELVKASVNIQRCMYSIIERFPNAISARLKSNPQYPRSDSNRGRGWLRSSLTL